MHLTGLSPLDVALVTFIVAFLVGLPGFLLARSRAKRLKRPSPPGPGQSPEASGRSGSP